MDESWRQVVSREFDVQREMRQIIHLLDPEVTRNEFLPHFRVVSFGLGVRRACASI